MPGLVVLAEEVPAAELEGRQAPAVAAKAEGVEVTEDLAEALARALAAKAAAPSPLRERRAPSV